VSSFTKSLVLTVAAIGFLFDTYELLMFPVIGTDAVGELLRVNPDGSPASLAAQIGLDPGETKKGVENADEHPTVREWAGRMLWVAALCGGVFGLLGGFLVDRLGRKKVMIGSIIVYSFSPLAAAYSTELWMLILFRCTTFIGVCVEMVAAVTWLAELFETKRTRELVIGWTLACASLGGIFVTEVYSFIVAELRTHPEGVAWLPVQAAAWRYTLLTGLVPGALILLFMPFVPESTVWSEKKKAGTLARPRFSELFSPALVRTTLVTAALSACAYAAAFGALQLTPLQMAPALVPDFGKRQAEIKGEVERLKGKKAELKTQTKESAAAGAKMLEPAFAKVKADGDALKQEVKAKRGNIQRWQELGGLTGRILFAILLLFVPSRTLMRIFLVPGIVLFPLTYLELIKGEYAVFATAIFFCGLLTVAQMSYMSEFLPKVFPVHLRGTGAAFATNVGARMIGTMAATFNTEFLANALSSPDTPNPLKVATAAAVIGGTVYFLAFCLTFLLPAPREAE
jgi:MFS family permease